MNAKLGPRTNGKTPAMWAVANSLLALAVEGHIFIKPDDQHKAKYIPLSVQISKSKVHKNAVSVHDEYISFMVRDWSMNQSVIDAGFTTNKKTNLGMRLHVCGASAAKIEANQILFRKLMVEADTESRNRQTLQPRKAIK